MLIQVKNFFRIQAILRKTRKIISMWIGIEEKMKLIFQRYSKIKLEEYHLQQFWIQYKKTVLNKFINIIFILDDNYGNNENSNMSFDNSEIKGNFNNSNYFNYIMSNNEKGNPFVGINKNNIKNNSNEQIACSFNAQYNYYATWCLSPGARVEFNSILNNQPIYNVNYNKYGYDGDEGCNKGLDKNLFKGKYTCKFEIQIENDNEFQIARRLIGSKVI